MKRNIIKTVLGLSLVTGLLIPGLSLADDSCRTLLANAKIGIITFTNGWSYPAINLNAVLNDPTIRLIGTNKNTGIKSFSSYDKTTTTYTSNPPQPLIGVMFENPEVKQVPAGGLSTLPNVIGPYVYYGSGPNQIDSAINPSVNISYFFRVNLEKKQGDGSWQQHFCTVGPGFES